MGHKTSFKTGLAIAVLFLCSIGKSLLSYAAVPAPKDKFTLVIDAGHGGKDPGAVGRFSKEKNINLSVALAFGKLVEANCPAVKVIYTRKTDVFIPLDRRAEIANKANADLFVSVHTNALPGKAVGRGAETYTLGMARAQANLDVAKRENAVILVESDYKERYQGFDPNSAESYIMFEFMQDKHMEQSVNLAKLIQQEFRSTGGRLDKGVHQAGFLVLRQTSMPSVLIELGYISTHDEESFLNSQNGIRKMSQSIYNAFQSYRRKVTKSGAPKADDNKPDAPVQEIRTVEGAADIPETDTTESAGDSQPQQPQASTPNTQKDDTSEDRPVFKVQLMASTRQIPAGSSRFKKLSPINFYKEGAYYKYTYGETTDYQEAKRLRDKAKEVLDDVFIIAFKNGKKMELRQAIEESKRNK